jgi:signal transduction histidine kinase
MMWRWLGSMRSFADKVSLLMTLTSGIAICVVCFTLAAADYWILRRETLAGLSSQTLIVAMNSGAPLAFFDRTSATEALSAFKTQPAVAVATLYDLKGNTFARYERKDDVAVGLRDTLPSSVFGPGWRHQVTPIDEHGQRLGTLDVLYDLRGLQTHLLRTLALSAAASLLAIIMVYLFSLVIRGALIKPVALLSQTARKVSQTKDYSQRARKVSDDELGTFTDAFNQMLEQIQKQDIEIQASRADALKASQLKDEFLATLSHELRTPMVPILGWAQVLRLSAGNNEQVLQAAAVIERNARAQNKIVDDLLDMSRIISGKLKLEVRPIDLADVVLEAIDIVAPAASAKSITLGRQVERGHAFTHGDPHRLQQVVWNLLSNAIKFTDNGGRVGVSLRHEGGQVVLEVGDSGQGIAAEFLPHVFERFRQADSSTTRQHQGLGLGLAIVRQLVELHGGSVSAASAGAGHGATFTVRLPATARASAPVAALPMPVAAGADGLPSLRGLKVLLVDDEVDARDLIENVLCLAGATVFPVGSAESALAAIDAFHPHVLLSDIAMPEVNGYDLIRRVRQAPAEEVRAIPAIALTALVRPEDGARALAAGFQQHLSKPVDNDTLIRAVHVLAATAIA